MTVAERVNLVSNFKVIQGRLDTMPKSTQIVQSAASISGTWNAAEVRKSLDVLCAFIDSTMPRVVEEEGEVTWEDVEWQ